MSRGAGAGMIAYSIVYPLTVVSTILQVQAKKGEKQYSGTMDTFLKVFITLFFHPGWG